MASLEENDSAFAVLEICIRKIADALDFRLLNLPASTNGTDASTAQQSQPQRQSLMPRCLFRTLPYALGISPHDDTIELICATSMSATIFWEYFAERLELDAEIVRPENGRLVLDRHQLRTLVPVLPSKTKIAFQYSKKAANSLETGLVSKSEAENGLGLAKAYDAQVAVAYLARSENLSSAWAERAWLELRRCHLALRQWATSMGLLSSILGLLNEETLLSVAIAVCTEGKVLSARGESRVHLDNIYRCAALRDLAESGSIPPSPSGRNLLSGMTPEAIHALRDAVSKDVNPSTPVGQGSGRMSGLMSFANAFPEGFVKIQCRCWVPKQRQDFAEALPSVLLKLQAYVRTHSRNALRIWPHSFSGMGEEDEVTYILGAYETPKGGKRGLPTVVDEFFSTVSFDRASMSIFHFILPQEEFLQYLSELQDATEFNDPDESIISPSGEESSKFRTASAVMNRLRWDPRHAAVDYEVGYVDRFEAELMWKPLEKWEKHTEEEEFVPEHRVKKIRRRDDVVVVWDRERRFDRT